ncbi:hypothetical protein [Chromobacterium sp. Beijing]|uniref:hypothetical protein n=1 Tax=Chromobacterium sp. Beijing TaxID=2735795 RepID=UPI001F2C1A96|nr:hypothetical protein [Chromobacterium sp. Beijing]UJB30949.1 hypothetical protein HQN78_07685 [Chromobacterium sp. Beijing]
MPLSTQAERAVAASAMDTLQSLASLMRAIERLNETADPQTREHIAQLCRLAAEMAQDAHNELDLIRERAAQPGRDAATRA